MIDDPGRRRRVVWALLLGVLTLTASAPTVRGEEAGVDGAVGCRTLSTRPPERGEIVVDSAPIVIEKPGTYILTRDIQSPGSCIGIAPSASGCILDLNGHTITYGTGRLEVDPEGKGVITYNSRQMGNVGHGAVVCPSPDGSPSRPRRPWRPRSTFPGGIPSCSCPAQPGPGEVDTPYSLPLFVAAETTATWNLLDGKLPDGLRLKSSAILGTPTREGRFPFTLLATADGREAAKAISITIAPKPRRAPRY